MYCSLNVKSKTGEAISSEQHDEISASKTNAKERPPRVRTIAFGEVEIEHFQEDKG